MLIQATPRYVPPQNCNNVILYAKHFKHGEFEALSTTCVTEGPLCFFLTRLFWHSTWSVKPSISPGAQASYNTTLIRRLRWKLGFLQNKIKVKANCKTCTINFGFKNCVTSPNRTGQTRKENLVARYFERTIPVFICFIWRNSRI